MSKRKKIELSTWDFKTEIYCVIESRNRIFYTKYFHYQQRKSITHDKKIKRRYIRDNFTALNLKEQNPLLLFFIHETHKHAGKYIDTNNAHKQIHNHIKTHISTETYINTETHQYTQNKKKACNRSFDSFFFLFYCTDVFLFSIN